jgi:predicted  nucleic acid-binding Zn-ribbon protein
MLQKEPVFLLNESPQVRATALSVGQESNYISTMIQKHKDQVAQDSATIREGEKEMSRIIERISKLEAAIVHAERMPEAETLHERVAQQFGQIEEMEQKLDGIVEAMEALHRLEDRLETLAYLPDPEDLRGLEQSIRQNQRHVEIATSLEDAVAGLGRGRAMADILAVLPGDLPKIRSTDGLISLGKNIAAAVADEARMRALRDMLSDLPEALPSIRSTAREEDILTKLSEAEKDRAAAMNRQADAEARRKAVEEELNDLIKELGPACPVCGSHLDGGHIHGEAA